MKCNFHFAKNCKIHLSNALWSLASVADLENYPSYSGIAVPVSFLFAARFCLYFLVYQFLCSLQQYHSFSWLLMCKTPLSFCLLMPLKNDCSQTNSNIYKVCCNSLTHSIFHLAQLLYFPITYTRCCNIAPNLCME